MATLDAHQLCWNHETREAVCRCLGCGRSYCRECVTEHEGRLVCANCIGKAAAQTGGKGAWRKAAPAAMIVGGFAMGWLTYWAFGEAVMLLIHRLAQTPQTSAIIRSLRG